MNGLAWVSLSILHGECNKSYQRRSSDPTILTNLVDKILYFKVDIACVAQTRSPNLVLWHKMPAKGLDERAWTQTM